MYVCKLGPMKTYDRQKAGGGVFCRWGGANFWFPGSNFSRTELRPLKTMKMELFLIIFNFYH